MSVKIIVDSTADLTPEVAQQVKTVPLRRVPASLSGSRSGSFWNESR